MLSVSQTPVRDNLRFGSKARGAKLEGVEHPRSTGLELLTRRHLGSADGGFPTRSSGPIVG